VKYACIEANRTMFPVKMMCRVLGVSRAGFYAARDRAPSNRAREDERLRLEIRAVHRQSKRRYGSPRVHDALQAKQIRCGENRVARLMRLDGLRSKKRRRFRVTTNSDHALPTAPNLLEREFDVGTHEPDQVWVADMTYIPTREGWLYLAVVLDLATRIVVGWSLGDRLDRSLALNALRMALGWRRPRRGAIHHSDRGSQYASREYRALLASSGMRQSMSRKGDCWDNAVAESFFATLEWELIEDADWRSRTAARREVAEYIEIWYNRTRRHSSLNGLTPTEYEAQLALTTRAA
jgi:putative transposase